MDRKKIALLIALIAVSVLVGAALYFVFFRAPTIAPPAPAINLVPINAPTIPTTGVLVPSAVGTPPSTAPSVPAPSAPIPTVAQGDRTKTRALTNAPAQFVSVSTGRPRYYDSATDQFYEVRSDGTRAPLSEQRFPSAQSIAWAPNGNAAIVEFPDGANVVYDFVSGAQTTLPSHWTEFSFSPDSSRIAGLSMALDRENRYLFEAQVDGNGFQAIEPLGSNADKVEVSWSPNNQVIAFSRTGNTIGDGRQQILAIGRNHENFPGLVVEGTDFRPLWSPSGEQIIYSAVHFSNDYKPELWVVDGSGDRIGANRRRLNVDTWATKCTFGSATELYCAVPDSLERGYGFEPTLADTIPDSIQLIDLTTGTRSMIGRPETDTSIATLSIAPDGSTLYFTAKNNGRLYEMRLR
ncbi:MAG: hypothetical protein ABIG71_02275 [Candidatus Uhrbacteria bacterium]